MIPAAKERRRTVPLDSVTVDALRMHHVTQAVELAQVGLTSTMSTTISTRPYGRLVVPEDIRKRFLQLTKEAGLPKIRLHGLRHTTCHARASRKGADEGSGGAPGALLDGVDCGHLRARVA